MPEAPGGKSGEVEIQNPKPEEIFPDPTATSVDECEYIGYVYRMHRMKAHRLFEADAARMGADIDELISRADNGMQSIDIDSPGTADSSIYDTASDTVRITEWWYRQPCGGEETVTVTDRDGKQSSVKYTWEPGDIALSVFIGDKEVAPHSEILEHDRLPNVSVCSIQPSAERRKSLGQE